MSLQLYISLLVTSPMLLAIIFTSFFRPIFFHVYKPAL